MSTDIEIEDVNFDPPQETTCDPLGKAIVVFGHFNLAEIEIGTLGPVENDLKTGPIGGVIEKEDHLERESAPFVTPKLLVTYVDNDALIDVATELLLMFELNTDKPST
jgi:hypothetical protein